MEYTEYMETLKEQIQNKRARSLVAEEIRGHIEEQAKEYQAEGMSKEDAEREAVRQMGDPVETGCALNRIHRLLMRKSMRAEYRRRRSVRCLWSMQSVLQ